MTNIAIIGLGKLGSAMAALYASSGHKVVGVDIDDGLIERLQLGTFTTDEPEVADLLRQHADRLTFTRLPAEAVHASEIIFVVVPTPSKADGTFDSSMVVSACQQIGAALYEKKAYTLVVVVSTLMPGQMDGEVVPALERASGKRAGTTFGVCYSPEFIALGRVVQGLRNPDYVLIGEIPGIASVGLDKFYRALTNAPIRSMSFVNAELAKLATNAYLSLKIAYANVLGQICEQLPGANVDVVTQAVGADHRIGSAYLRAGLPAGGVCLPRDLMAMGSLGFELSSFNDVIAWNQHAFEWLMRCIYFRVTHPGYVLVMGTAYSPDTHITDGSWGDRIAQALRASGWDVHAVQRSTYAQAEVDEADTVVLALPLDGYKSLQFHAGQMVFDIWRMLDPVQMPAGVELWQLGVGAKTNPYTAEFKGELTTLSVPLNEYDGGFDDE